MFAQPNFGTKEVIGNRVVAHVAGWQRQATDAGHQKDDSYNGDGQWRSRNVGQNRATAPKSPRGVLCDQNQTKKKNRNDDGPGKPQLTDAEEQGSDEAESAKQHKREAINLRKSLGEERA
jgi:hypothetical protein